MVNAENNSSLRNCIAMAFMSGLKGFSSYGRITNLSGLENYISKGRYVYKGKKNTLRYLSFEKDAKKKKMEATESFVGRKVEVQVTLVRKIDSSLSISKTKKKVIGNTVDDYWLDPKEIN